MMQYAFADIGLQTAFSMFALAGIPIILMGLWGVRNGVEGCLRVYLFYAMLSFAIDVIFAVDKFMLHHTCEALPHIMAEQGRAWACGIGHIFDVSSFFIMLAIPAYMIFIVWSYSEDMAQGGAGPDLSDLTHLSKRRRQFNAAPDPYSSVLGLSGWVDGEYGATFANHKVPSGLGGGQTILDGTYHEMEYPPPAAPFRTYSY